jgi:hypothetical protein
MNLIINIFNSENVERNAEILECLNQNIQNKKIKRIFIIDEHNAFSRFNLDSSKLIVIKVDKRLFISDTIRLIRSNSSYAEDEIYILSNNDIVFKKGIGYLNLIARYKVYIVLSRRENNGELFRQNQGDSTDSWVTLGLPYIYDRCDFFMGFLGVENRLAFEFYVNKFLVINPSRSIFALHIHNSGFRTYNETNRIFGYYLHSLPINLLHSLLKIVAFKIFYCLNRNSIQLECKK